MLVGPTALARHVFIRASSGAFLIDGRTDVFLQSIHVLCCELRHRCLSVESMGSWPDDGGGLASVSKVLFMKHWLLELLCEWTCRFPFQLGLVGYCLVLLFLLRLVDLQPLLKVHLDHLSRVFVNCGCKLILRSFLAINRFLYNCYMPFFLVQKLLLPQMELGQVRRLPLLRLLGIRVADALFRLAPWHEVLLLHLILLVVVVVSCFCGYPLV